MYTCFIYEILDLLQSDALNLNGHTLGQLVNGNTAASRLVNEELLVGGVHFGEVGHVSKEDLWLLVEFHHGMEMTGLTHVDLDDLGHAGSSGGQDGLDVVTADLGLVADVTLDQVGGGISGDLAGDEDLAVGADGLGL